MTIYSMSKRGVRGYSTQERGRRLIKHPVIHFDDLPRTPVDQKRIVANPDPDGAEGRRRQIVNGEIRYPIVADPEGGRQDFSPAPAAQGIAARGMIAAGMEMAGRAEIAMEVAHRAEIMPFVLIAAAELGPAAPHRIIGLGLAFAAMELAAALGFVPFRPAHRILGLGLAFPAVELAPRAALGFVSFGLARRIRRLGRKPRMAAPILHSKGVLPGMRHRIGRPGLTPAMLFLAFLVLMLTVLGEGRTGQKADNGGGNEKFAHRVALLIVA